MTLLSMKNLRVRYPAERRVFGAPRKFLNAVDGVSLDIGAGETLALVGESGCGKTSLGRSLLRLVSAEGQALLTPPAAALERDPALKQLVHEVGRQGAIDLLALPERSLKPVRRQISLVFQDPYSSLNPRMNAWRIVSEPLAIHKLARGAELRQRAEHLLEQVGLDAAVADRLPHEFSGGQRQRLGIARALASDPALVVCDEAVSALDVSVQAQILELLQELQAARGLSYLFITHDLSVVRQVAHRTAVMYLGQVVEEAPTEALFGNAQHPYTQALLAAVPVADPNHKRARLALPGEPPSPADPPAGCRFHPRCAVAIPRCSSEVPVAVASEGGGQASCFLAGEQQPAPIL